MNNNSMCTGEQLVADMDGTLCGVSPVIFRQLREARQCSSGTPKSYAGYEAKGYAPVTMSFVCTY